MSRHTKMNKFVKDQMELMDDFDEDEDSIQQDDYNDDQLELINNLAEVMVISSKKSADVLEETNFDFDKALQIVQEQKKQEENKAKKKQQKQKQKEMKRLQKQAKQLEILSKKSAPPLQKKSSMDQPILARRKSSIVEDYKVDHYNIDYPSVELKQKIQPSKTLNIVVVGHVDSGKSTLVGKLLHLMQEISKKQIHKNEKGAKQIGKQSFQYAWVTDETEEQRQRGVTIDVGVRKISLKDRNIVFLDSPGHKDFIPNMITGAAQADYAILVIDATHFDSTFISGGQTKEHAYIVKSLGVHQLIVVINKMDLVDWSPEAFLTIQKKLNFYLLEIGFQEQNIMYLPISAFYGINIHQSMKKPFEANEKVYDKNLIQVLSELHLPVRPVDKPLRVNITNFYESPNGKLKGHCISGKIEGGMLKKDDKLVILPQNCQCVVKDILLNEQKVKVAAVGDNVDIQLKLIEQTYFQTIRHGNVLSSLQFSIPVSKRFVVQAMALDLDMPVLKGTAVVIYIGSNKATARITKINCKYDPKNGMVIKKNCKSIRSNDCVEIEVETDQRVCVEKFSNSKIFGRVIIRQKKSTLCVGTVTMIK